MSTIFLSACSFSPVCMTIFLILTNSSACMAFFSFLRRIRKESGRLVVLAGQGFQLTEPYRIHLPNVGYGSRDVPRCADLVACHQWHLSAGAASLNVDLATRWIGGRLYPCHCLDCAHLWRSLCEDRRRSRHKSNPFRSSIISCSFVRDLTIPCILPGLLVVDGAPTGSVFGHFGPGRLV